MKINFFTQNNINRIHDLLIKHHKETHNPIAPGMLIESTLDYTINHITYQIPPQHTRDETILLMAFYLLNHITTGHIYIDGNKRTAFIAFFFFLHINGIIDRLTDNYVEHESFLRYLASKNMHDEKNIEEIRKWYLNI